MSDPPIEKKLSPKRRRFVEAYLATWNASEAARQAEYAKPGSQGQRLLTFVEVQTAIQQRLAEVAMKTDEVLARLAEQARSNIASFFTFDSDELVVMALDIEEVKARGHLIKKLKQTKDGWEIELYDGQAALVQIGKHLKLFPDRMDITSGDKPIKIKVTLTDDDTGS